MADTTQNWATRLQRPSWRDWRLVVGIILVLGAVGLGAKVVGDASRTVAVYAAATPLASGKQLSAADVTVVHVNLAGSNDAYLQASSPLPPDSVLTRPVGKGELLANSAISKKAAKGANRVMVSIPEPVPAGVQPGAVVDVWAVAKQAPPQSGKSAQPTAKRVAESVEVFDVAQSDRGSSYRQTVSVQVILDQKATEEVLQAQGNQDQITLIPVAAKGNS